MVLLNIEKSSRRYSVLILLSALIMALGGCSGRRHANADGGAVGQIIRDAGSTTPASAPEHLTGTPTHSGGVHVQDHALSVWGQKLKHTRFDYPVTVNPGVEHWISYFTGKGRRYFDKYLERGRYFIPEISRVLKSHNMPQDLVYLAMIESGFNNTARSHARAVGPWQFMKQTGQRYGLTVDYWLDERRDTHKATLAAIAYLKELYQEFGSWELAAAGYNAGENKVRRAIAKYKTRDFWEIARHKFFRRETRDYVPKIMAAAILTKNAELFGLTNPFGHGVKNPTILADDEDSSDDELTPKELGELIAKDDTSEDAAEKQIISPEDKVAAADDADETEEEHAVVSSTPTPGMSPSIYMVANPNEQIIEYEVKSPADLFAISKASGLPFSTVKLLNPELSRWCTPPYMKNYPVKLPKSVKDRFLATYNDESFDRKIVFQRYTVKRGDTLQKISKRFSVESAALRDLNSYLGLKTGEFRVGSQIALPLPTGYKRVIASMYDEKPAPPRRRHRARRLRRTSARKHSAAHHERYVPKYRVKSERKIADSR